jgi:predicted phosphodiesterase
MGNAQVYSFYEKNDIELIPFGDLHYGDKSCNIEKIETMVKWIKNNPKSRVILMGDLINCASPTSVSSMFEEDAHGQEQYNYIYNLLLPIKDKIYGSFLGNHENRIMKTTGYNVTEMLAREMGHKYFGYAQFIRIKIKDTNYIIYGMHGSSGPTPPQNKLKRLIDISTYFEADIFLMGHVHSLQSYSVDVERINLQNKQIEKHKRYYVITGHYLNYKNSYAEMKSMVPEKQGSPVIMLSGNQYQIRVSL